MNEQIAVFVYGTLKKGFGNHRLLSGAVFVGEAVTVNNYALYVSGIPYAYKEETISKIHGELYLVDRETLQSLDMLEGHPDWYRREEVMINLKNNTSTFSDLISAWLYFSLSPSGSLVEGGVYERG